MRLSSGWSSRRTQAGRPALLCAAVADAFAVPNGAVTLVRGANTRRKLIEIDTGTGGSELVRLALRRLTERADE